MPVAEPDPHAPSKANERRGGCLCGSVQYRITGPIGPLGHCHCETCRKSHAAAFATTARVAWRDFEWIVGEEEVRAFESSPGKKRTFCRRCGSPLFAAWDDDPELILRLGSLEDDPGSRPLVHIWTQERAPWLTLGPRLPAFPRGIPRREDDTGS